MEDNQPHYDDRRHNPYCNTPSSWDSKTVIALIMLVISTSGGLLGVWSSVTTQVTTISVTQQLKFDRLDEQFKKVQQDTDLLIKQVSGLDSSLVQMYTMVQSHKK